MPRFCGSRNRKPILTGCFGRLWARTFSPEARSAATTLASAVIHGKRNWRPKFRILLPLPHLLPEIPRAGQVKALNRCFVRRSPFSGRHAVNGPACGPGVTGKSGRAGLFAESDVFTQSGQGFFGQGDQFISEALLAFGVIGRFPVPGDRLSLRHKGYQSQTGMAGRGQG